MSFGRSPLARDLHYSPETSGRSIVVVSPLPGADVMEASAELQRWGGRACLLMAAVFGLMGYYYANVRVLPIIAGRAILGALCYIPRPTSRNGASLRPSGQHPAV